MAFFSRIIFQMAFRLNLEHHLCHLQDCLWEKYVEFCPQIINKRKNEHTKDNAAAFWRDYAEQLQPQQ